MRSVFGPSGEPYSILPLVECPTRRVTASATRVDLTFRASTFLVPASSSSPTMAATVLGKRSRATDTEGES